MCVRACVWKPLPGTSPFAVQKPRGPIWVLPSPPALCSFLLHYCLFYCSNPSVSLYFYTVLLTLIHVVSSLAWVAPFSPSEVLLGDHLHHLLLHHLCLAQSPSWTFQAEEICSREALESGDRKTPLCDIPFMSPTLSLQPWKSSSGGNTPQNMWHTHTHKHTHTLSHKRCSHSSFFK